MSNTPMDQHSVPRSLVGRHQVLWGGLICFLVLLGDRQCFTVLWGNKLWPTFTWGDNIAHKSCGETVYALVSCGVIDCNQLSYGEIKQVHTSCGEANCAHLSFSNVNYAKCRVDRDTVFVNLEGRLIGSSCLVGRQIVPICFVGRQKCAHLSFRETNSAQLSCGEIDLYPTVLGCPFVPKCSVEGNFTHWWKQICPTVLWGVTVCSEVCMCSF